MALDPALSRSLLQTPDSVDITERPLLTMVTSNPAFAADLVPYLGESGLLARNARRVLCAFDTDAVPVVVAAAAAVSDPVTRRGSLEIIWTLLITEEPMTIRRIVAESAEGLRVLLDDRSASPEDHPDHVEVDFRGRICDYAYVLVQRLLDRGADQSTFRALDDVGRDSEIRSFRLSDSIG